jgi:hydroxymethylbilane synthase
MARIVLGTRGSALALWQARHVTESLIAAHADLEVEQRIIKTEGDMQQHAPLGSSDVGVFVRRIESALAIREIDLAVHSLKDLPTTQPDGLVVAAVPARHDPRDGLLSAAGWTLDELPQQGTVATGSPRRKTQILKARPDLRVVPVRGNVDTRIRKLTDGQFDALVLAVAGVERLGIDTVPMRPIDPRICLPAVGQGALAVEVRADDAVTRDVVRVLDDPAAHAAVRAERACLRRMGGGCLAPATAHATVDEEALLLTAVVGDGAGTHLIREIESGPVGEAETIGERLGERMLAAGAGRLLELAREVG